MNRFPIFLFALLLSVLIAGGCSDSNNEAPAVDEAHPRDWIFTHDEEAQARLVDCTVCHGSNFEGAGQAVSCFACHFVGPPQFAQFFIHPPEWGHSGPNVVEEHQTFPFNYSWTTCANFACHGTDLRGGATGPSCFLAQCHSENEPPVPHPTGTFFQPSQHGALAENNQLFCRNCHGRPPNTFDGGFVADPLILNRLVGNCSVFFCHPAATAHPTNWQGSNDVGADYLASHRDIDRAAIGTGCVLCHDVNNAGATPFAGAPSCFSAQFTNADGSTTACHPNGP